MKTKYGEMTRREQKQKISKALKLLKQVDKGSFYYGSDLKIVIGITKGLIS